MARCRAAAKAYADVLDAELPDGPDKTFVIRAHRSNAMWVNVAVTRQPRRDAPRRGDDGLTQTIKIGEGNHGPLRPLESDRVCACGTFAASIPSTTR